MKDSSAAEPRYVTDCSERGFSVLLVADAADRLEQIAQTKAMPVERLLHWLITEYVKEESRSFEDRIRRVNELVGNLVAAVRDDLMQTRIAGTAAFEERQRKRDRLVELGMGAFEAISKISESEQLAKESEF